MTPKRKLLIMELWGLGDLTFATPILGEALRQGGVHLLGKEHATPLLKPSFPGLHIHSYDAPWTRYRGKYNLWAWRWREFFSTVLRLRREKFDVAVSVRNDPRDHLFMWFIGARERHGYPRRGSRLLLTHPLRRGKAKQHKVEDWREIGAALGLAGMESAAPHLDHAAYRTPRIDEAFRSICKPVLCLHTGARIAVRRWPAQHFAQIIGKLRSQFDFHLLLIPDPDGYDAGLASLADSFLDKLSVVELVDALGRADLLLCNDSGPSHLAASCGRPAIAMFGPSDPDWFRPWGDTHRVIIRDICPWRPCFDYCKFLETHCMTKLLPDMVWPEIHEHIRSLITRGALPDRLLKNAPVAGVRA